MPFADGEVDLFTAGQWSTLESDADNAIVQVFDDAYDLIDPPGEGFINTQYDYPYYQPASDTFAITLNSGIALDDLEWLPPYNPFLRVNSNNAKEVHLPDYPPTDFADPNFFQTEDDDTNPAAGRFYKTENNLPWAIHLPQVWFYPLERDQISWGYLQFADWAESGGNVFQQWYFFLGDRVDEDYIYVP